MIARYDFRYDVLTDRALEQIILQVLKAIDSGNFKPSGAGRRTDWEKGWQENLDAFVASGYDIAALAPKYISKYEISRLFSRYIKPRDPMFELNFYTVYRHYLFTTFLACADAIFEFGCGTGYNIAIMHQLFPHMRIMGLDWAESSVAIANTLGRILNAPISGRSFNYFRPDFDLNFPENSLVITLNSLEQIGQDHGAFLDFLLKKRPALCVHAEPFVELYDGDNLIDYLAIRYHTARNYLAGYLPALQKLVTEGRIEIIKIHRIPFGNLFHEGYSLVIWKVTD